MGEATQQAQLTNSDQEVLKKGRAAINYLPMGGLQLLVALANCLSRDKFIKFHALQALLYWGVIISSTIGAIYASTLIPSVFLPIDLIALIAIALFLFVIPIFLAVMAYANDQNSPFHLPLLGGAASKLAGLE